MSTIRRISNDPYECTIEMADLSHIANAARSVPRNWINESGNDVTSELINYMYPLIQGEVEIDFKNGLPEYMEISHLIGKKACNI